MLHNVEMLEEWVKLKHRGQLIRSSGQPYFEHLIAVAEMAASFTPYGYEIGLCHDLLEKTGTTPAELGQSLLLFGYHADHAAYITGVVLELSDVFTKSAYPQLSKKDRKEKEAERLVHSSPAAQTVKYADLAYNIQWVVKYDREHIANYLLRKQLSVIGMTAGNADLRQHLLETIDRLLK